MRARTSAVMAVVVSMGLGSYLNLGLGMDMTAWDRDAGAAEAHACCRLPEGPSGQEEPEGEAGCCALVPGLLDGVLVLPGRCQGDWTPVASTDRSTPLIAPDVMRSFRSRAPPGDSPRSRRFPSPRAPPSV
ncbi:hypothetical protein ACFL2T_00865 [Elusimicrobiota bacterium]